MKIKGLRQVVHDLKTVPRGFHLQVWCEFAPDGETCEIWTGECLPQGSWERYPDHPEYIHLSPVMSEIFQAFDAWIGPISYSDCIRKAVRRVQEGAE